jgi:hypothetical protein
MSTVLLIVFYYSVFATLITSFLPFDKLWQKLFWTGVTSIPSILIPIYFKNNPLHQRFWPGMFIVAAFIAVYYFLNFIGVIRNQKIFIRQQDKRDKQAADLANQLTNPSNQHLSFALYLRPFTSTNNIPTSLPSAFYSNSEFDGVIDFELTLENALKDKLRFYALGHPHEAYGAGRIETDEATWKSKIIQLMQQAKTIFVIPSDHAGTKWEIEHILQMELITKCIFIMPPTGGAFWKKETGGDWQNEQPFVDQANSWTQTQLSFQKIRFYLPDYQSSGAFFTMDGSGRQLSISSLPLLIPEKMNASDHIKEISRLIGHLQDNKSGVFESDRDASAQKSNSPASTSNSEQIIVRPRGFEKSKFYTLDKLLKSKFFILKLLVSLTFIVYWSQFIFNHFRVSLLFLAEYIVAYLLVKKCLLPLVKFIARSNSQV